MTMITPVAIESIGYKYYIVYTCIGFCIPLSIYFLYPEVCLPAYIISWLISWLKICANGMKDYGTQP